VTARKGLGNRGWGLVACGWQESWTGGLLVERLRKETRARDDPPLTFSTLTPRGEAEVAGRCYGPRPPYASACGSKVDLQSTESGDPVGLVRARVIVFGA
jgi:hypothetical protein